VNVVILAGEGEYSSGTVMELFQHDIEKQLGAKATLCVADPLEDLPDLPLSRFAGIEALADADLLAIYTRFRRLPDDEMELLDSYLKRGGPVLGLRTSTHAFAFRDYERWRGWNDGFGTDVLGTRWIRHHGHSSRTLVRRVAQDRTGILEGVPSSFQSRSWLYVVDGSTEKEVLLNGEPIQPETEAEPGPVAWVRTAGRRVFYSSLGHPDDFGLPAFRRLLVNAARWCLEP
jgi:type 1 glutamine amidotransferase